MKKFIKVSLYIVTCLVLFIFGSKLFFNNMIHYKDYTEKNKKEIKIVFESQSENLDGIYIRFKVLNHSKYRFLLNKANLVFPNHNNKGELDMLLRLDLQDAYKGNNKNIMVNGIEEYGEGYVTFLIPKGIILDETYFDIDSTQIEYEGEFKLKLPFLENKYISIGRHSGSNLVSNGLVKLNIDE